MNRGESTPPRFYCPIPLVVDREVTLPDAVARHAVRALRLRSGDPLTLFDGSGGEYRARLARDRDPASAAIVGFDPIERESPLAVTLAQGVAVADRMDLLVQKAVELGVAAIEPVITSRCVVRLDDERAGRRQAHWQQIVVSACEQCGRNRIPPVARAIGFDTWIRRPRGAGRHFILSTRAPGSLVAALAADGPGLQPLCVLAGPEGGFSDEESRAAVRHGFTPVGIGPRVVRTETAALAALAVLQALAGDLR